ncbi:tetratricopeptide repeat protein [Tautonia rosea]|uniref:tetratricopeptide repeat protein n=1 Tax=Tautonia rosea TaxID=2728037 RepID=UPI0014751236|nr:tetratricopeptide repeat protein [Tautonia rosea]
MPVWHDSTRSWVNDGRLVLLGVTQEQHADRCRLFARWQEFEFPILHDPINVLQSEAVPILTAIDEHGIVRDLQPRLETFEAEFLDRSFPAEHTNAEVASAQPPDLDTLRNLARSNPTADAWRSLGDALALWGGIGRIDEAIEAYEHALALRPDDADSRFRLGVCHRMRFESPHRLPGDFQAAVDAWGQALNQEPNQYIWRRRIEQYGPRLAKPYPFYDWVDEATEALAARGEPQVPLAVMPTGAEIAQPSRDFEVFDAVEQSPDPQGRINRDRQGLIEAEVAVVPAKVRPGATARVHVTFLPNAIRKAHWNNESTPLRLWIEPPEGWRVSGKLLTAPQGDEAETNEIRRLDFEVEVPSSATGPTRIPAFALYNVCEDLGGVCLFLRQDLVIEVDVIQEAP